MNEKRSSDQLLAPADDAGGPALSPRADALPEFAHYPDNGCAAHPFCLKCPELCCLLEGPRQRQLALQRRQAAARRLRQEGKGIRAIMAALGCSERTAFRLLAAGTDD